MKCDVVSLNSDQFCVNVVCDVVLVDVGGTAGAT